MKLVGNIRKMHSTLDSTGKVVYQLPMGERLVDLNPLVGQKVKLTFTGKIQCVYCGFGLKKTYQQGYCFLATRKLARCDICIVKPELCHYHKGTCREPAWGEQHCMQVHYVYLANASGLKVGITRAENIPTRWVDQGAVQALPILKVTSRYAAGLVEVAMTKYISDKTNWRKMLQNHATPLDLMAERNQLLNQVAAPLADIQAKFDHDVMENVEAEILNLQYPVQTYPTAIKSLSFDKQPSIEGQLIGIKGQYWIFDCGVVNMRKHAGYELALESPIDLITSANPQAIKSAKQCPLA